MKSLSAPRWRRKRPVPPRPGTGAKKLGMKGQRDPALWLSTPFKGSTEVDGPPVTRASACPPGSAGPPCAEVLELSPGQPRREGGHGAKGGCQGKFQAL